MPGGSQLESSLRAIPSRLDLHSLDLVMHPALSRGWFDPGLYFLWRATAPMLPPVRGMQLLSI